MRKQSEKLTINNLELISDVGLDELNRQQKLRIVHYMLINNFIQDWTNYATRTFKANRISRGGLNSL